jgi:hypothetical protein
MQKLFSTLYFDFLRYGLQLLESGLEFENEIRVKDEIIRITVYLQPLLWVVQTLLLLV